jgi:hypothetical protein
MAHSAYLLVTLHSALAIRTKLYPFVAVPVLGKVGKVVFHNCISLMLKAE